MSISDEILMAYADGELASDEKAAVESAMLQDPAIAAKVEQHRALRFSIHAAFAPILDEELPACFSTNKNDTAPSALAAKSENVSNPNVVPLDAARQQREDQKEKERARAELKSNPKLWAWREWGSLAAMLMLGVIVGRSQILQTELSVPLVSLNQSGHLTANGKLASALTSQLSSDKSDAEIKIGLSFLAKEGNYCRSFATKRASGLACHENSQWQIPLIVENHPSDTSTQQAGEYRPAGSELSPLILELIDQKIAGHSFDEKEEKSALAQGWKPVRPK